MKNYAPMDEEAGEDCMPKKKKKMKPAKAAKMAAKSEKKMDAATAGKDSYWKSKGLKY